MWRRLGFAALCFAAGFLLVLAVRALAGGAGGDDVEPQPPATVPVDGGDDAHDTGADHACRLRPADDDEGGNGRGNGRGRAIATTDVPSLRVDGHGPIRRRHRRRPAR